LGAGIKREKRILSGFQIISINNHIVENSWAIGFAGTWIVLITPKYVLHPVSPGEYRHGTTGTW